MVAACGSGSGSPNSRGGVGDDFGGRAVAVCRDALADKRAEGAFPFPDFNPTQPDMTKFPQVARFLEKTAATFTVWDRKMKALGEPRHGQRAWHNLLAAIETHVRLTRDQISAARTGDAARFADDYQKGAQTQDKLLEAATAAGVKACADVDR